MSNSLTVIYAGGWISTCFEAIFAGAFENPREVSSLRFVAHQSSPNKVEKPCHSQQRGPAPITSKHVKISLRIDIHSRQEGHVSITAKLYCMKANF